MNPNNLPSSNPNSQVPNTQVPYSFLNSYFSNPNSQVPNTQFSSPQNYNFNVQTQNPQFSFLNPFFPCGQNPQYQFPFVPNSPNSQFSVFGGTNPIDLNDDCQEVIGQWKYDEDKLLISAWLNVSIDPMVGTDQKGEKFWERIREYCEESIPGLIKRGGIAMKKRWQRINEGAQRYGACYEQAERKAGSGSNLETITQLAHELHIAKYNKKSNFEKHWTELRRQPKWRAPSTNCESTKRTKLSDSGAYSSSKNNETPTDTNEVESPIRPKGSKSTKRKGKGKAAKACEELEILKSTACRKLSLMEEFVINEQKKEERRAKEQDLKIIMADTTTMNETQQEIHAKFLEEIYSRRM